ncbi:hypothetical protein VM98_33900, partial [Streptomyces rubellomurinus subsp. indigoferus]
TYAGLPVLGGDLGVHQSDARTLRSVDKAVGAHLSLPRLPPQLPADQARALPTRAVQRSVGIAADKHESPNKAVHHTGKAELVIWASDRNPRLASRTSADGERAACTPSSQLLVTDPAAAQVLPTHETGP